MFQVDLELVGPSVSGELELTGTTTICAAAVESFVQRHGLIEGGYFEGTGVLQREPDNPVNSDAVIVLLEGERIGYAPSYAADLVPVPVTVSLAVPLRFFTVHDGKRRWTRAFVWLDPTPPRWAYSRTSPPPLTSAEKRADTHRQRSESVRQTLAEGGAAAAEVAAGMVNGVHYREMLEPIQELKRQGRNEDALQLCYAAIEAAEGDLYMGTPVPFPTREAAIVLRKLKQRDEEIAVLQRWLAFVSEERRADTDLGKRLAKLLT